MATIKKACKGALYPKSSSVSRKLKSGGGFPDLNKDGKITKKDVLIGRGVLPKTAKKGMKIKKAQDGKKMGFAERTADTKKRYEAATNPKLEGGNRHPMVKGFQSIDTTGLAAGKTKGFPSKIVTVAGKGSGRKNVGKISVRYRDADKTQIEGLQSTENYAKKRIMKKKGSMEDYENRKKEVLSNQRKGGVTKKSSSSSKMKMMKMGGKMTKKCMHGCK
jgi:hypothetical protein